MFRITVCVRIISVVHVLIPVLFSVENRAIESDLCPFWPRTLVGPFDPDISTESLETIEQRFHILVGDALQPGGFYKPRGCKARYRIAIIVPCRGRQHHIPILLKNLHALMMRQQLEYQIFIVFQAHGFLFNRGALFNVGYLEVMKQKQWDCLIFHDVDLIPMDDRNLYNCPGENPRHMAVALDKWSFRLPYDTIFGGVVAFTPQQYETVNGLSNSFWGWGGEDDDLYNRISNAGFVAERYSIDLAKYIALVHEAAPKNPDSSEDVERGKTRFAIDGLNSIKYHILEMIERPMFTQIMVQFIPEELGKDSKQVFNLETLG